MTSSVPAQRPVSEARAPWHVRAASRCARGCRLAWNAAAGGVVGFYNSDNLTFAASIAYYSLLSFFPFFLMLLTIFGKVLSGVKEQTLVDFVIRALPSHFEFVINQIGELTKMTPAFGVVHIIVLTWASMGVFGAITSAVNHAWGVEKPLSFFKHKLVSFVMLMLAGVLTVAALTLVGFAQVLEARWFSDVLTQFPVLETFRGFVYRNAATPMFIMVVGLIYYFVPNARVRLRDVWLGALLAGGLWRLAFAGFSWYVHDLSRFSVHGSIAAVVVFLVWVYLSAVILLYGAEVSAAYARLRKNLPTHAPAAAVREEPVAAAPS